MPMQVEYVGVDLLKIDSANARVHDRESINYLKRSLKVYGQRRPIIIDEDNTVICGNGILTAARELGFSEVAVVRSSLGDGDLRAYALADNKLAELSTWDVGHLAQLFTELDAAAFDLCDTGFPQEDIEGILSKVAKADLDFDGMTSGGASGSDDQNTGESDTGVPVTSTTDAVEVVGDSSGDVYIGADDMSDKDTPPPNIASKTPKQKLCVLSVNVPLDKQCVIKEAIEVCKASSKKRQVCDGVALASICGAYVTAREASDE